jgi:alkaline phosphatase
MALIGHGADRAATGVHAGIDLEVASRARMSLEALARRLGGASSAGAVHAEVRQALGIELTDAEVRLVLDDALARLDPASYGGAPMVYTLAFALRFHLAFVAGTPTASPLFVHGVGRGAERLSGFHHNTELFGVMKAALLDG